MRARVLNGGGGSAIFSWRDIIFLSPYTIFRCPLLCFIRTGTHITWNIIKNKNFIIEREKQLFRLYFIFIAAVLWIKVGTYNMRGCKVFPFRTFFFFLEITLFHSPLFYYALPSLSSKLAHSRHHSVLSLLKSSRETRVCFRYAAIDFRL